MDGIVAPETVSATDPVLIFWTGAWGLREGDRLRLAVFDLRGEVFVKNEHVMERNRATESRLIGRKRRGEPWPPGIYRGTYRVERKVEGTTVVIIDAVEEVEVR
jgi:hypothetical protein